MAQRTVTAFKSTKNSRFADNTTGGISEQDSRDMYEDVADSFLNIPDHFIDEDSFASDSPTKVPSQQSVKAYVDAQTGGGVLTATVTVSSAEILALNATPKQLIAAPGANKIIQVLGVTTEYIYVTSTYTTNLTLAMRYGAIANDMWRSNVLSQVATSFTFSLFGDPTYTASLTGDIRNTAVNLTVLAGNPAAGDGTLKFVITYRLIDFT